MRLGGEEKISYDANGNTLKYQRKAFGSATAERMDNLTYNYITGTNKLNFVRDTIVSTAIPASNYTTDIDDTQTTGNYAYDSIGNLIKDVAENITSINWNVYGKITDINKNSTGNSSVKKITYTYDAGGNRISKKVDRYNNAATDYTFYVRDASGNIMSVYTYTDSLRLTEQYMYGSSRLGSITPNINMQRGAPAGTNMPLLASVGNVSTFIRGIKFFELSNHLGNVLVTLSDKKKGIQNGTTGSVLYYLPIVKSAQDYYPFGMVMPGRKYSSTTNYRYGFNGKEEDDEVKGDGNSLDFGARIYDGRLGRWLSTDLITKPFISPYNYSSNNPVNYLDPNGEDNIHFIYLISRTYVNGKLIYAKPTKFTIIEKNNEPNVFIHHKVELRTDVTSTTSSTTSVSNSKNTRFYPDIPGESSDLTTSYGILKVKDDDRKTLIKFVDEYGLSKQDVEIGYTELNSPGASESDRMKKSRWWAGVFSEKEADEKKVEQKRKEGMVVLTMLSFALPELAALANAAKGGSRIQAGSLKEFKSLVQQLSKPGSQLTKAELQQFEKLTEQFGGKLRYDLNPVKGKILQPHVQVEGLGTSVGSSHIWLGQ